MTIEDSWRKSLRTKKNKCFMASKNKKSPRSDGWIVEFFSGFFDLIGKDILEVIEESRRSGHIHPPLNSTFIAIIPKTDIPKSFDDFRPISLCNVI